MFAFVSVMSVAWTCRCGAWESDRVAPLPLQPPRRTGREVHVDVIRGRYCGGTTRWPGRAAGSALLLVIVLGGLRPGVGALFRTVTQAVQAELTVLTGDASPVYTVA